MPKSSPKFRTLARLARKSAPPGGGGSWAGGPMWSDAYRQRRAPTPGEMVEAYKSILFFLSGYNSKAVASTPLRLYVTTGAGQRRPKSYLGTRPVSRRMKAFLRTRDYCAKAVSAAEDVEEVTGDHPLIEAFHRCNPFLDPVQILSLTVTSLDVLGQAYWEPTFKGLGGRSVPDETWLLPAQVIWPVPDGTSLVPGAYQYFGKRYGVDELIRFRNPGLRSPYMDGVSGGRASIAYARLEDEFVSKQDAEWSNGPRPSLWVSPKDAQVALGDTERKRLRQEFNAVARGGMLGGLVITDGAIDVKPVTYAPADPGALAVSEYNLDRMANSLDIPPPFYSRDTNLANMQAARDWHARNAVEPRCKAIAAALTRFYKFRDNSGALGWDRLVWAFDPVVEEDKKAAADQHKVYLDMGVYTRDEVRHDLGFEPLPDGLGEVALVAGTLKTLDQVVNPPEPPPALAPGAAPPGDEGGPTGDDGEETEPPAKSLGAEHRRPFGGGGGTKFNPNHDAAGHFAAGHGGGAGGYAPVSYSGHDANAGLAHGASTAQGDPVRSEVPNLSAYAAVQGPEVHGVKIPDLGDAGRAQVEGRILRAAPAHDPAHPQRVGRDEETVLYHGMGGATSRAAELDTSVRGEHAHPSWTVEAALTAGGSEGRRNARALAVARETVAAVDRLVGSGRLTRTLVDGGGYLETRLQRPAPAKSFPGSVTKDQADRGVEGAGEGEDDDPDNTFGLPDGNRLAAEYRRWLRRVAREVLGDLPMIGVLPADWPDLRDFEDPMAAAFTPLIGAFWDEAGRTTRAKLGLDADEWRVVDPHLHQKIEDQSFAFCQSTLATTADDCRTAYDKLRHELLQGLVTDGESVPELAKRVRAVFTGASRDKAVQIARTESSRAVHAASEESAKESGVVAGKVWLLSSNACDFCHELERKSKAHPVPLGGEFASVGKNPTYASIKMPPGHVNCRCSVTYELSPEYQAIVDAHPPAGYEPGAMGPQERAQPRAAEVRPEKPGPPLRPQFAPAKTLEEAVEFARSLGVKDVDFGARLDIANHVNRGLAALKDRGLPVVPKVRVWDFFFKIRKDHAGAVAMYTDSNETLLINPLADNWADLPGSTKKLRKVNFISSDDPSHVIFHESGHYAHHRALGTDEYLKVGDSRFDSEKQKGIARKVSDYGATQPAEFVAEVYAGMVAGKRYDEKVMDLYRSFGGPLP